MSEIPTNRFSNMLLEKCNELYHLVEEQHEHPSPEIEEKIKELKEEIDRILAHSYDNDSL